MSTKEQRRQKKLVKKKTKEVAKRKQQARQKAVMQSLAGQMRVAGGGTLDRCFLSEDLFADNNRIGSVLISRFMPDGRVACARILVDAFCLGVKNVDGFVTFPANLSEFIERVEQAETLRRCQPAMAKKFVEEAIAYAAKFGIEPHADYRKVESIWSGIDASECDETFQFGDEKGKPRYISGPFDSSVFQQRILDKLRTHAGEGNYEFVMMVGDHHAFSTAEEMSWMEDPELDADIDEDVIDGRVIESRP
ncbi:hypothetical protein [Novipirellula artificiosorum]|uniref:Uncharacterized protein n=1 Tax=Novipirellula artificiosorum TaxID=2528016 RepID=A0A5C6E362_9BACT|nr:hypothetical protein [Novipirellula artificiosorum]TWU42061.1 hypothetical protein Poly41_03570 [Novipirellula artificiosorum]